MDDGRPSRDQGGNPPATGEQGLFLLVQRNILHRKGILADQLITDRIVE